MATNLYSNTQQRLRHHIPRSYKVLGDVVIILATIALLAKLLHSWLCSWKDVQEDDAGDRHGRRSTPSYGELDRCVPPIVVDHFGGSGSSRQAQDRVVVPSQPPAPTAVAVEMVRAMGPLVCTYQRADGWPAEVACAVCLAELADGDALRVLPVCMHYFHATCVGEWLRAHDTRKRIA